MAVVNDSAEKSILQLNTLSDLTRDKLDPKTPELQLLHKTVEMLRVQPKVAHMRTVC